MEFNSIVNNGQHVRDVGACLLFSFGFRWVPVCVCGSVKRTFSLLLHEFWIFHREKEVFFCRAGWFHSLTDSSTQQFGRTLYSLIFFVSVLICSRECVVVLVVWYLICMLGEASANIIRGMETYGEYKKEYFIWNC